MKKIFTLFLLIVSVPAFAFAINLDDYKAPTSYVEIWYDYEKGTYETHKKVPSSRYYDGVLVDVKTISIGGITQSKSYETSTHLYGAESYNNVLPGFGLVDWNIHLFPPLGRFPNIVNIGDTFHTRTSLLQTGCLSNNNSSCESVTGEVIFSGTILGFEIISTPMGTFNALKVQEVRRITLNLPSGNETDTSETFEYLVVGLGSIMTVSDGATSVLVSTDAPLPSNKVSDFVSRFYQVVLGRSAETGGHNYWVNSLVSGTRAGADVAREFIFSNEFMSKNLGNEAYLEVLYSAFFNREADPGGRNHWLGRLYGGTSREEVLNGFIYSQEFADLCQEYSITPVK
jgi:hypothetical protein